VFKQQLNQVLSIGLTGGIASGKSTVAKYFSHSAIKVISADQIARELLSNSSTTLNAVKRSFGAEILDTEKNIDRKKLRALIFNNKQARKQLDAIMHPAIGEKLFSEAAKTTSRYVILEIPLLIETGMYKQVDRVLVVDVEPESQIMRIMQRDNCSRKAAQQAIEP